MNNSEVKSKETRTPVRRKRYLINKKFQGRFTISFLLLGLIVSVCCSQVFWYFATKKISDHLYDSQTTVSNPWKTVFPLLLLFTLIFILVLIVSSILLARGIFNRFFKKISLFCASLEEIGHGNFVTPVITGGIEDLEKKLEETRKNYHQKMSGIQNVLGEIKKTRDLKALDQKTIKDIKNLSEDLKEKLSGFKYRELRAFIKK
jgi:hypothetical protein